MHLCLIVFEGYATQTFYVIYLPKNISLKMTLICGRNM